MMALDEIHDLERVLQGSKEPVLALFHARWCPFCRSFLPLFHEASVPGVKMVEVDISDDDNPLWEAYGIEIVPTLVLFHQGRVVDRADGRFMRGLYAEDLERLLQRAEREALGKG